MLPLKSLRYNNDEEEKKIANTNKTMNKWINRIVCCVCSLCSIWRLFLRRKTKLYSSRSWKNNEIQIPIVVNWILLTNKKKNKHTHADTDRNKRLKTSEKCSKQIKLDSLFMVTGNLCAMLLLLSIWNSCGKFASFHYVVIFIFVRLLFFPLLSSKWKWICQYWPWCNFSHGNLWMVDTCHWTLTSTILNNAIFITFHFSNWKWDLLKNWFAISENIKTCMNMNMDGDWK